MKPVCLSPLIMSTLPKTGRASTKLRSLSFVCLCLLPSVLFFSFLPSAFATPSEPITPERDIVTTGSVEEPEWKILWDEARKMTRQENYLEAARRYSQLLSIKKNIEEAMWEYGLVLIALSDWRQASSVFEGLLEIDPHRVDYQLSGALVALKLKEYNRAISLYRRVYDRLASQTVQDALPPATGLNGQSDSADGQGRVQSQYIEVLTGLIAALQGAGITQDAYPLMEKLYRLRPGDTVLLHQLAVHAVRTGQHNKAVRYYEQLLAMDEVADRVLLEACEVFEGATVKTDMQSGSSDTRPSLAFGCWEKYLQRHPDYLPFQKKVAEYLLARGKGVAALPHLLILLDQQAYRDDYLLTVGSVYLHGLKQPEKALPYYEEYLLRHPDHLEIAREKTSIEHAVAQNMVARINQAGAVTLWKELEPVAANRLTIYRAMAELLERRGNTKELDETLTIIHRHDPKDAAVVLRLAELAQDKDETDRVEKFLGALSPEMLTTREQTRYLLVQARHAQQRQDPIQALNWYERYLRVASEDLAIRRHCLELAASLGLMTVYDQNHRLLLQQMSSEQDRAEADLRYVRVLLTSGLAAKARTICRQWIEKQERGGDFAVVFRLALADVHHGEGDFFEAEQILREMLADGLAIDRTLSKLVELNLENIDGESAQIWFQLLQAYAQKHPGLSVDEDDLTLLQARVLAATGRSGKAVDLLVGYRRSAEAGTPRKPEPLQEAEVLLARLYLLAGQYEKGGRLMADVLQKRPADLDALILARQLDAGRSGGIRENRFDQVLDQVHGYEFPVLIQAARLEQRYGEPTAALKYAKMALEKLPESILARVVLAEIVTEQGDLAAASAMWEGLAADYPQETRFARRWLEGEFGMGRFQQIIARLAPSRFHGLEQVIPVFPDTSHLPAWQRLMLARSLWAEKQWVAAVAVYDSMLRPSVDKVFTEDMERQQVQLVLPPARHSLWSVVTFSTSSEPDRLAQVMEPAFLLRHSGQPAGRIGAAHYASFRWQQMAARELSAKRALAQGDYYQAMKRYQQLIATDPSPESLFDLAGIYSRLGLLGKEALLYEEIGQNNPDYPDLATAIERNQLKRQPKVMADFGYASRSGRDGYLDIEQTQGGASVWILPTLRQELNAGWSTIHSVSKQDGQGLRHNRFLAEYSFYPHHTVDLTAGLGGNKNVGKSPEENGATTHDDVTPLYRFEARGRIGDELHGFVRLSQDVVDDTVQALKEGITRRDLEGGVSVDLLPRLFCGGEYLFREYSDANQQNRYHVWVSYLLFREPTLLRVTYGQELLNNDSTNLGRFAADDGPFAPGDHPYWSPGEYWQNLLSVRFEHQLAADVFGRKAPSYYALDYSVGYEEGGYDNHSFGGDIFLEISRHFLLNSRFDLVQGGREIRKDFALSLVYRW